MKRTLCLLLVLCLLAGLSMTAAAAPAQYTALGDSIADGYRLEGYTEPGCAPKDSFPVLAASELGMQLNPLAVSGMDTDGLLLALELEHCKSAVAAASVISLTIGSNDLLIPAVKLMMEALGISETDLSDPAGLQAKFGGETPTMAAMLELVGQLDAALTSEESLKLFDAQLAKYKSNWEAILAAVRALNPTAEIYVTNYYNPFKTFDFSFGSVSVTFGKVGQGYLDQMNAYLRESPSAGEYTVVDITDVSTNVKFDMADLAAADMDPHPDKAGHALIAQRLLAAMGGGLRNFSHSVPYTEGMYKDLPTAQWAKDAIRAATELGFMKGADGAFDPKGSLTLAQVLTMAARVHSVYVGDGYAFDQSIGDHWYDVYVMYCVFNKLITADQFSDYSAPATRAQMAYVFARAVDDAALSPVNTVAALPDVAETDTYGPEIYSLYRAGVLSGNDALGTFTPDTAITREQAAAIVSRLAEPALRVSLKLEG